ncbi:MAG: hypothetical protein ACRYG8_35690, partial [Janthinobacterium lividum]
MTHARSRREVARYGSVLDENAGSVLSKNQHTADSPSFAATILAMQETIGLPERVLADTGYAS